jgi:hypothetical protein
MYYHVQSDTAGYAPNRGGLPSVVQGHLAVTNSVLGATRIRLAGRRLHGTDPAALKELPNPEP